MTKSGDVNIDYDARGVIWRLVGYFRSFRLTIVAAMAATLVVGGIDSSVVIAVTILVDLFSGISQAVQSGETFSMRFTRELGGFELWDFSISGMERANNLLWMISGIVLALVLLKGLVYFSKEFILRRTTHKVLMHIKQQLFDRIVNLPLSKLDRERSGEMLSRITFDVSQLEHAVRTGIELVKSAVYAVIIITVMVLMEWSLTLMALAVFPLSVFIIRVFGYRVRRTSGLMSRNVADYTSFLNEAISGAMVTKAFGRERDKMETFRQKVRDNYRYNMRIARIDSVQRPLQDLISTGGMIVVILFCGYRLLTGAMSFGDLSGFILLLVNAYKPVKKLGETNTMIQRAIASGQRIFLLLDEPDETAVICHGELKPEKVRGQLRFDGATFGYVGDQPAIEDVSLTVKPGETLALVGPSGAGKSTLVNLIPRFYRLQNGRILLDGVDTSDLDLQFLRSHIAIVPQDTILFSGTVEDNIRFGKPEATSDEIRYAAQAANAHDFIEQLGNGYQTEVGERGVQLSGGQRQRIAIARAVLRNPRILLLDEATSSLDSESEKQVQEALVELRRNRTTIVIAHRLSTVQSADRIAVLDRGRMVELGTHKELYALQGVYRRLYEMQFAA